MLENVFCLHVGCNFSWIVTAFSFFLQQFLWLMSESCASCRQTLLLVFSLLLTLSLPLLSWLFSGLDWFQESYGVKPFLPFCFRASFLFVYPASLHVHKPMSLEFIICICLALAAKCSQQMSHCVICCSYQLSIHSVTELFLHSSQRLCPPASSEQSEKESVYY